MTDRTQERSRKHGSTPTEAQRTGHEAAEQAKAAAGQAAGQVKEAAGQAAGQAREQVATGLSGQKDRAAQSLGSMTQALRTTGQKLREQDQAALTPYADRLASEVERASGYIERRDLGEMVDDVERFSRRQPALFLGGAFMLGLIGARFLKSSVPQRYRPSRYPLARRDDQADLYGREPDSYPTAPAGVRPRY